MNCLLFWGCRVVEFWGLRVLKVLRVLKDLKDPKNSKT